LLYQNPFTHDEAFWSFPFVHVTNRAFTTWLHDAHTLPFFQKPSLHEITTWFVLVVHETCLAFEIVPHGTQWKLSYLYHPLSHVSTIEFVLEVQVIVFTFAIDVVQRRQVFPSFHDPASHDIKIEFVASVQVTELARLIGEHVSQEVLFFQLPDPHVIATESVLEVQRTVNAFVTSLHWLQ
jgi:hypothetical protein